MKNLISTILLLKSLFRREFTKLDICLAFSLKTWWTVLGYGEHAPAWLEMIANLDEPNVLPEAWADFWYEVKTDLTGGA